MITSTHAQPGIARPGLPWKDSSPARMSNKKPSIEELLRRVRAGDGSAVTELFNIYQPRIARWAKRQQRREHPGGATASDIGQQTVERVWRKLSTFQGNTEAELDAWCQSILKSQETQTVRHALTRKRFAPDTVQLDDPEAQEVPTPQPSPSANLRRQEEDRTLLVHLWELPEDQRTAIYLYYLKELRVAEVAARMKRSEPSVAGLVQRGLKTLRSRIDQIEVPDTLEPAEATVNEAAAALLAYMRRRDAGEQVDQAAFLLEHPHCAEELSAMLHWSERIRALRPSGNS